MFWNVITDFGDSAAMLPAAVLLGAWLLVDGQRRAALIWAALFAGQAILVAATKIAFRGWGIGIESLDFTGISGHSALACSVIPIGVGLAAQRGGRLLRLAAVAAGMVAGLAIGVSRVALAQHSWSEVLAGCVLGSSVALLFLALLFGVRAAMGPSGGATPDGRLPVPVMAGVLLSVIVLMHGTRAPSDRVLTKIALHLSGHSVPYTRNSFRDPWLHDLWLREQSHRRVPGWTDYGSASRTERCGHVRCDVVAAFPATGEGDPT